MRIPYAAVIHAATVLVVAAGCSSWNRAGVVCVEDGVIVEIERRVPPSDYSFVHPCAIRPAALRALLGSLAYRPASAPEESAPRPVIPSGSLVVPPNAWLHSDRHGRVYPLWLEASIDRLTASR